MKEFIIQKNEANQRFDKYLRKLLPNAGSSFLYKMLRKKNITLNGSKAEGTETLHAGDQVRLFFSDETFEKFSADKEALRKEYELLKTLSLKQLEIIYEDSDCLIANKPANMLSQKADPRDVSANERLLGYLIRGGKLDFEEYQTFHPSVCNRLDRNTTGLLLMGKTLNGLQTLSQGLKDRSIQKYYRAIVIGRLEGEQHLKGYLSKNETTNQVTLHQTAVEGSAAVETAYRSIMAGNAFSLIEIHLITGKTHQIRAHLASIGHPILGDLKYGNPEINLEMRQRSGICHQLLHAWRLVMPDGRVYTADTPQLFKRIRIQ